MKITYRWLIPMLVALSLLVGGSAVFAHEVTDFIHNHIPFSGYEDNPGRSCGDAKCNVLFSGWTTNQSLIWQSFGDGGSWSIALDYRGGTGICDRSWIFDGTWRVNKDRERLRGGILGESPSEVFSWVIWPEGHGDEDCDVSDWDIPYGGIPTDSTTNHAGYTDDKFAVDITCDGAPDACLSPVPGDSHEVAKFLLLLDNGYTIEGCLDDMHLPSNPLKILSNPPKVWGCVTIPASGGTDGEGSCGSLLKNAVCTSNEDCSSCKCKGKPDGVKSCK